MGHIRERPEGSGTWQLIYDLPRGADGKRKQSSKTFHGTERQAKRELAQIELEIHQGTFCEPTKMNLAQYLDEWMEKYARQNVSRKTFQEYAQIIKNHIVPELGHVPLQKLMPLHILDYQVKMLKNGNLVREGGLKPTTVVHHYTLLHTALGHAVDWMLLNKSPIEKVKPPKAEPYEPNIISISKLSIILKATEGTDLYVPIIIAFSAGMRLSEIVGLKWEHVDFDKSTIGVVQKIEQVKEGLFFGPPKSRSGIRGILMPHYLVYALRKHKTEQAKRRLLLGPAYEDNDLVCPAPDGQIWPPNRLSKRFSTLIKKIGVENLCVPEFRFHDLRHMMASLLEDKGVNLKETSQRLGHADPAFTLRSYVHASAESQKEAAELIDGLLRDAIKEASSII